MLAWLAAAAAAALAGEGEKTDASHPWGGVSITALFATPCEINATEEEPGQGMLARGVGEGPPHSVFVNSAAASAPMYSSPPSAEV